VKNIIQILFLNRNVSIVVFLQKADLKVELLEPSQLKPKPADLSKLVFGNHFTDYMFEVSWDISEGWSKPKISPVHELSIHPGAKSLHYGIEVSE